MKSTFRSTISSIIFLLILLTGSNQLEAENILHMEGKIVKQEPTRFLTASTSGVLENLISYTYVINTSDTWQVNKITNVDVNLTYQNLGIGFLYFTIAAEIVLYNTHDGLIVEEVDRQDEAISFDNARKSTEFSFSFKVTAGLSQKIRLSFTSKLSEGLFNYENLDIDSIKDLDLITIIDGGKYIPKTTTDEEGNTEIITEFETEAVVPTIDNNSSGSLFETYESLITVAFISILVMVVYLRNSGKNEGDNNTKRKRSRNKLNVRIKEVKQQFEQDNSE